ncbi:NfeD family protein [Pseudomonas capsici]|uniref:NfeD family protein n=1 Tax=Pseudomonas capsici TaxID=2810614 RepID=A0ABT3BWE1_9PSED|nr:MULTISPECIES: NfeD family protein [Pseudomonas]MBN6714862.1 NfeD family protein [Pseudomonas capsici]MBN6719933.1 NfeD family protein [Pseudomonas capsici]MBN6724383.1 NfeD family protein [Pseudomonas capsici]MCV4262047.1 NfeD family protein [Pseudomonas capsici]MCV4270109.1 NfeD family protein [Pseudomonas capsici]
MNFLQNLSAWDWLGLGTVLLIFEVFGAGGYLLWIGIAAASVGILTFVMPEMPWALQFLLFALFSVLTAAYWWHRQRSVARPSDQPGLNMRGQELIGRTFTVQTAIVDGRGKIKAADTVWIVTGPDAPTGSLVKVIGQEGAILKVEAPNPN